MDYNRLLYCEGQSRKTVSTNHNLFEEKGEPKRNRAEALLVTSLIIHRSCRELMMGRHGGAKLTKFILGENEIWTDFDTLTSLVTVQ